MPATKAPSTVCTPIRWVISAMPPIKSRITVMTAASLTRWSLVQRISLNTSRRPMVKLTPRKTSVPSTAFATDSTIEAAVRGQAEDDGDDDPADGVVDDRRSDDDLADIAAHEVHLAHDHGDDLDRRDRQRGAEEQRRHQPLLPDPAAGSRGRNCAEREAADEGHHDAGDGDAERGAADLAHQLQVGLHAGQQQQQQDAELRDAVDQRLLLGRGGKDRVLRLRPEPAEQRGAEQQAGQQLADDRGLADPLHQLAEPAADRDQQRDLDEQDEFGRGRGLFASAAAAVTISRSASPAQNSDWSDLQRMRRFPHEIPSTVGTRESSRAR